MKRSMAMLVTLAACGGSSGGEQTTGVTQVSLTSASTGTGDGTAEEGPGEGPGTGPGPGSEDGPGEGPDTKWDLGVNTDFCVDLPAGIHCDGTVAVTCDGNGGATDTENCPPAVCVTGEGCVACMDGEFSCKGPRVMSCNTAGADPVWEELDICDSAAGMVCDAPSGSCIPLAPIGGVEPTGEYYQYAVFDLTADGFSQISDVDSHENRIYFVGMQGAALTIGRYDVQLLDSDGDGMLEPNQHPDNPDEPGAIEERVFTFVESFPAINPGAFPNVMELYAKADSIVYSGMIDVREHDFATDTITQIAPMPTWIASTSYQWVAFLGYDEVNQVWYSGNESARRVFQFDSESQTWGYAFEFPALAGDHMDGIEVVTDVTTGTPYVYVSDMTSNFIGQYRHDPDLGWVQENLFTYVETAGAPLEGFGFGALNHFWCGSLYSTFYELGGGDIQQFVDPEG